MNTKLDSTSINNPKGSIWHRWEPHIHIPGTVLNDQFNGLAIDDYCKLVEQSSPTIKSLGITDYYSLASYEEICKAKLRGRLSEVDLIFPNVELRFKLATASDKAVNGHLLFSPKDPNHIQEIKRFLQKLTYSTGLEVYSCQATDLIKLGKDHNKTVIADNKALEIGTNQFKVDFDQLIKNIKESTWAQENLLVAVASGKDGSSGLQNDASFSSTRQHIERASHIIFSGNEKTRAFWLGKGVHTRDEIISTYNSCKPCLHGSDAHKKEDIGKPLDDKFTWIKGDVTFESLRQACIEPEGRAFIGSVPPENHLAPYIIFDLEVTNAEWMNPSKIPLNSGLVTVIGARGSGKTALADMIATGGYAISEQLGDTSFIKRAFEHLNKTSVKLQWQGGTSTEQAISDTDMEDLMDHPRVQYLSQKFVDQLCSSEGMTDRLILEIEKVIFNAHPKQEKLGITNFQELLSQKAFTSRAKRIDQEELIEKASEQITVERAKKSNLPTLTKRLSELSTAIENDKKARTKLLSKDKDSRLKLLDSISAAFDVVSVKLESALGKLRMLSSLKQNVSSARTTIFPNYTSKLRHNHAEAGLSEQDWKSFEVDFKGNVDGILSGKIITLNQEITKIRGIKPVDNPSRDPGLTYIPLNAKLEVQSYEVLSCEVERLKKLIGIDTANAMQYTRISERIQKNDTEQDKIKQEIADAETAQDRITKLFGERKEAYKNVFEAILAEERDLKNMYSPLMASLKSQKGSLGKLTFTVRRQADINSWAQRGEDLLDLRKVGPFRGKGSLRDAVKAELKNTWETGSAEQITEALAIFRDNHENGILEHSPAERKDYAAFSSWANKIAEWLYSTDHIAISYGVIYDGVDIQQLSPGTRGIVLLLLYLAIDQEDDRPLIIDQPEENLDPKSIFEELVPLFKNAKNRRQIIIVTHNANLVVNTDADQVIIANAGSHEPGKLPSISYMSGGLENPDIRNQVCEILEGGEAAFKERAKRLRVSFS